MEAGGKSADIDCRAELDFAVVTLAQDGGVEDVAFEEGEIRRWDGEVSLAVIAQASDRARVFCDDICNLPDDDCDRDGSENDEEVGGERFVVVFCGYVGGLLCVCLATRTHDCGKNRDDARAVKWCKVTK